MRKINIRPATIDDLDILSKYMNDLDSNQVSLNPRLSKSYLTPKYQAQRTRWIQSALLGELPGVVFYIIPNKGFALLMIKQEVSDIYLSNLLISEEYRGMGIGSAFIAWLKNFRDQYYPGFSISLSCLNKNLAAQAFYESHGFVPVKRDSWATVYSNMPDNSLSLQLQNFARTAKKYFDAVGCCDCSVIDMNSALENSRNIMLQQRITQQKQQQKEEIS